MCFYFFLVLKKNFIWRCVKINLFINEAIRDKTIRLIDSDGTQLGIVSIREALDLAEEKKLDLVKIAPDAKPPVCKIMDYSKYKYEQVKKAKEAKKKQKIVDIKEIRISVSIGEHDLEIKKKKLVEFIDSGHKVKLVIRFRGREIKQKETGEELINKFKNGLDDICLIEKPPIFENRNIIVVFSPVNKNKIK